MTRLLPIFLLSFWICFSAIGQDIIFKNPANEIAYNLDTSIISNNKVINIDIGPSYRTSNNTIFFNKPFRITNDSIHIMMIKGSFIQHMVIDSSRFGTSLYIDSTVFDTLFFRNCKFKEGVVFENVTIQDLVLDNNVFNGFVSFLNCKIEKISIIESRFDEDFAIINSSAGELECKSGVFNASAYFNGCKVTGNINFEDVSVHKKMNISGMATNADSKFLFQFFRLPNTLDFSRNSLLSGKPEIKDEFQSTLPKRRCKILLNETDVSKLSMEYGSFELIFPKDYSADAKERTYSILLDNYKSNGFQNSYRQLDIEYRRFRAREGLFGFMWWLPEFWWLYGYDREKVFSIAFWAIIIFIIVNYFIINELMKKVYAVPNIPENNIKHSLTRLWFATIYTAVVFFSLSLKMDKIQWNNKGGTIYLIVMYFLGLLCVAYMANYIIQR